MMVGGWSGRRQLAIAHAMVRGESGWRWAVGAWALWPLWPIVANCGHCGHCGRNCGQLWPIVANLARSERFPRRFFGFRKRGSILGGHLPPFPRKSNFSGFFQLEPLDPKNRRSRAAGPFSLEADGTREEGKEGERRGKKRGGERSEHRERAR